MSSLFASETAKHRGFCEAASLKILGPHVQHTHKPGIRKGSGLPLRTFSLVRFFDVCQRNEQ